MKNQVAKSYFYVIFTALLLSAAGLRAYGEAGAAAGFRGFAPERTSGGINIQRAQASRTSEFLVREIRALDRMAGNVFKSHNTPDAPEMECHIRLSEAFPPGTCRVLADKQYDGSFKVIAEVGSADASILGNQEQFRNLAAAVVLFRCGIVPDEKALRLFPQWLAVGMQGELAVRNTAGKVVRGVSCYPVLSVILAASPGASPELKYLPFINGDALSGSMLEVYSEFCRFLLVYGVSSGNAGRNVLLDYLLLTLENGSENRTEILESTLFADRQRAAQIPDILDYAVFNEVNPRPGKMALALFEKWRVFEVDELSASDHLPTGKKIKTDILNLPALVEKDAVYAGVFEQRGSALHILLRSSGDETRQALLGLLHVLQTVKAGRSYDASAVREKLEECVGQVCRALDLQIKRDIFLASAEDMYLPLGERYRAVMLESMPDGHLSGDALKFFEEEEKKYLAE